MLSHTPASMPPSLKLAEAHLTAGWAPALYARLSCLCSCPKELKRKGGIPTFSSVLCWAEVKLPTQEPLPLAPVPD